MEKIMSNLIRSFLAALLFCVVAVAAPFRIPANALPDQSPDTENWVRAGIAASQNPLVYVTMLTGLHSGATEIYEIANGAATRVGHIYRGGGGALAVDSQQNVYIIEADYDQNLYERRSHVFVYPRGSAQPSRDFIAQGFGAQAMTVGVDGTVYMSGQLYPNINAFGAMKFAPGSSTGQWLPADAQQPIYPTGIAVDSSGNVFAGWLGSAADPCESGCIEELAPGKKKWTTRVPDLAANSLEAGPFVTADGSLIFWTGVETRFNFLETVSAGHRQPSLSQVAQLPPALFAFAPLAAALNGDGTEIWGTAIGLGGVPGSSVYQIDYPSGNVSLSFPVNDPKGRFFFIIGLTVSPIYYPAH
jgi:hypothetical protein